MQAEQPVSPIDIPQATQQSTADVNVVSQSPDSSTTTSIAPPETIAAPPAAADLMGTSPASYSEAPPPVEPASPPTNITPASSDKADVQVSATGDNEAAIAQQQQRLDQQLADIVARDRAAQAGQPPTLEPTPEVAPSPVTVSPFPSSEQVEVRLEPRTPPTVIPRPRSTPITHPSQDWSNQNQPLPNPPLSNWNSIDLGATGEVGAEASRITPPATYQPATNQSATNQPQGQIILPPGGGNSAGLIYPLASPAPITSPYGWRIHPISGDSRLHKGVDYGAPTGTPILAAARGRVDLAGELSGYGSTVVIRHNNDTLETLYAHMSQILVKQGQWVEQGTVIGLVGSTGYSTGPHLHFEVLHPTSDGWVAIDPVPQIDRSVAQQNIPVIQPVATANQTVIPGNPLTVTTLQPTAISNPAIVPPNLVTMRIGLNGVVETSDPVANLMSLGNRLVSFQTPSNRPNRINPVGVLAPPLAFSSAIPTQLSSLISPKQSQPTPQGSVRTSAITPQITSQEWVTFPPPASLIPGGTQMATATQTQGTTNRVISGSTPANSQPITASSSPALNRDRQQIPRRQTALKPAQPPIAAKPTSP